MAGKLIILSAPSGAGKTTLVKHLLNKPFFLEFSISATSRKIRNNELDGRDYYFISVEQFKQRIKNEEFIEWEEVYTDCFYGTLKTEIERIKAKGKNVVFDVDVVGGLNIKKQFPQDALSIFVMPPSIEILEERLRKRSTECEDSITKRVGKARHELTFADKFDLVIVNDNLEDAEYKVAQAVKNFLSIE